MKVLGINTSPRELSNVKIALEAALDAAFAKGAAAAADAVCGRARAAVPLSPGAAEARSGAAGGAGTAAFGGVLRPAAQPVRRGADPQAAGQRRIPA